MIRALAEAGKNIKNAVVKTNRKNGPAECAGSFFDSLAKQNMFENSNRCQ